MNGLGDWETGWMNAWMEYALNFVGFFYVTMGLCICVCMYIS